MQPPSLEFPHARHTWLAEDSAAFGEITASILKKFKRDQIHPRMKDLDEAMLQNPELSLKIKNISRSRLRDKLRTVVKAQMKKNVKIEKK